MSDEQGSRPPQAIPIEEVNRQGRRKVLRWLGIGGGLLGTAAVVPIVANWEQIAEAWAEMQLTDDQRAALEQYKKTSPEQILHDLKVGEEGANLRTRPFAINPEDVHDRTFDLMNIKLAAGETVPRAIKVTGQDIENPTKDGAHKDWYFIPNKAENPTGGAFSYPGNFEPPIQIAKK